MSDIQSSPAPSSASLPLGESEPSVMLACGAGEARFVLGNETQKFPEAAE